MGKPQQSLLKKNKGLSKPTYKGDPTLKQAYDDALAGQAAAAKKLPALMQDYIPQLIDKGEYEKAIGEMAAFQKFFSTKVLKTSGKSSGKGKNFKDAATVAFEGMDFDYITRMQERLLTGYLENNPPESPSVKVPEGMVYVPGGYFLMGSRAAKPADPEFPVHFVYVAPFLIDKYEVSNAEYRAFVNAMKERPNSKIEHPDVPPLKKHDAEGWGEKFQHLAGDNQPVVGVGLV